MHVNFNTEGLGASGGNHFIFELANRLVEKGYRVTITNFGPATDFSWFPSLKPEITKVSFSVDKIMRGFQKYYMRKRGFEYDCENFFAKRIPDCDVNIATWCMTVYPTLFSNKGKLFYLVQHFEPLFFPKDNYLASKARSTYELPLTKLCVSHWLTEKVGGLFIGNGVDLDKFKNLGLERTYDVMVIFRDKATKGNYKPAIEALKEKGFKINIVQNFSLSESALIEAYNTSKTFLYLSESEGFGYPPLEAMACGCGVVTTPCTEFSQHLYNAYVLQKNCEINEIILAANKFLTDPLWSQTLQKNAFETAKNHDLNIVVENFIKAINA